MREIYRYGFLLNCRYEQKAALAAVWRCLHISNGLVRQTQLVKLLVGFDVPESNVIARSCEQQVWVVLIEIKVLDFATVDTCLRYLLKAFQVPISYLFVTRADSQSQSLWVVFDSGYLMV